jgi:hypothetical protein
VKRNEIQKCAGCGQGVMHDGNIAFYRIAVEHMVCDVGAIRRQAGLEMMMGSPVLAAVMGPDQDLAQSVGKPVTLLLCQDCGIGKIPVAQLLEKISDAAAEKST